MASYQFYGCNCWVRNDCPLQHKCLTPRIVYQATVTNNNDDIEKCYHGLCETAIIPILLETRKIGMERELSNYIRS